MDNNNKNSTVTELARYLPLELRELHDVVAEKTDLLVVQLARKDSFLHVETLRTQTRRSN